MVNQFGFVWESFLCTANAISYVVPALCFESSQLKPHNNSNNKSSSKLKPPNCRLIIISVGLINDKGKE